MVHIKRVDEMVGNGSIPDDEFTYGDSTDLGRGKHQQVVFYKEKPIGYLVTKEKNWLAPLEETYLLPDVEHGLQQGGGLRDGKKGWIEFKKFYGYEEAFEYASKNSERLVYLFEYGDCD